MDELISVIIPIYKVEKYLDNCVKSVVEQTYKNLDIILVDDGSTDTCPEICDRWAEEDNRIRVIHKKMVAFQMLEILASILQRENTLYLLIVTITFLLIISMKCTKK